MLSQGKAIYIAIHNHQITTSIMQYIHGQFMEVVNKISGSICFPGTVLILTQIPITIKNDVQF